MFVRFCTSVSPVCGILKSYRNNTEDTELLPGPVLGILSLVERLEDGGRGQEEEEKGGYHPGAGGLTADYERRRRL